jgi:SAM-dependent methyltransferase
MRFRTLVWAATLHFCCALAYAQGAAPPKALDVPYEPSHPQVVEAMLRMANVGPNDVVYDLGCGDGRIVVAAAKKFGARGVGIDLDPQRIREAEENARIEGVAKRVRFICGDIMNARFKDATVVALYMLDEINLRLRPRLFDQLPPGARIVSHAFKMDDWEPDRTLRHPRARSNMLYLWIVPARAGGRWRWTNPRGQGRADLSLTIEQEFQVINRAVLAVEGASAVKVTRAQLSGNRIIIAADVSISGSETIVRLDGIIEGDRIKGKQVWVGGPFNGTRAWAAQREPVDPAGTWQVATKPARPAISPGKLVLHKGADGLLTAQYGDGAGSKPLWHLYDWGASIRFHVPLSESGSAVFVGTIEGDAMHGRVTLPNSTEAEWSARRVSR